jgi:hypothetical protein
MISAMFRRRFPVDSLPAWWGRPIGVALALILSVSCVPNAISAQVRKDEEPEKTELGYDPADDTPIADRPPFDRIIVNDRSKIYTLAVKPLGLTAPVKVENTGLLRFELMDRLGQELQLPWTMVQQIVTFEELVVDETKTAFRSGDLDRAFRNLIYLHDHRGDDDPTVKELLEHFLYRDAQLLISEGHDALAVTELEELLRRNPGYVGEGPSVIELLAGEYDRQMQQMSAAVDVDRIRAQLETLRRRFPDLPGPLATVVARWERDVRRRGEEFLDEAEKVCRGEDPVRAQILVRQSIHKLPGEARAWELYREVTEKNPLIIVGVGEFSEQPNLMAAENWSARRLGSLLQKQLVDLAGLGEEGGRYEFADGRILPTDEFGLVFRLEILTGQASSGATMTSSQLASRLASLVREGSPDFYFPLAKIIDSIAVIDHARVEVRLRQTFARFESLLRVPYRTDDSDRGVYSLRQSSEDISVYEPAAGRGSGLPVVERRFASSGEAAEALLAGEIDVLDRIPPAHIDRLKSDPNVVVRPYLVPSIHVLIPNPRQRYMRDLGYRRSLLYAIDRQGILKNYICGGKPPPGFVVISGPLPTGSDANDLIGYGYNERIEPVAFNSSFGIVAPSVVQYQLRQKTRKEIVDKRQAELDGVEEVQANLMIEQWLSEEPSLKEPTLVLAHPATEQATGVCQMIEQNLTAVGRKVELRPLPPGTARPPDGDYDLLYAEFTIEEPLVDMRRILGELGLAGQVSPAIEQLLSELDTARNWVQARQVLRQLHEQTAAEATVLPLWQTINQYAYRTNVIGLGESEVRLYDHVENWTVTPRTAN